MKLPVWHVIEQFEAACAEHDGHEAMVILMTGLGIKAEQAAELLHAFEDDPKEGRAQIEIVHMTK